MYWIFCQPLTIPQRHPVTIPQRQALTIPQRQPLTIPQGQARDDCVVYVFPANLAYVGELTHKRATAAGSYANMSGPLDWNNIIIC